MPPYTFNPSSFQPTYSPFASLSDNVLQKSLPTLNIPDSSVTTSAFQPDYMKDFYKANTNLLGSQADLVKLQMDKMNAFNWKDGLNLGISAFDVFNRYEANKINKKIANEQIANSQYARNAHKNFVSGTQSAFA